MNERKLNNVGCLRFGQFCQGKYTRGKSSFNCVKRYCGIKQCSATQLLTFAVEDGHVLRGQRGLALDADQEWGSSPRGHALPREMNGLEAQGKGTLLKSNFSIQLTGHKSVVKKIVQINFLDENLPTGNR